MEITKLRLQFRSKITPVHAEDKGGRLARANKVGRCESIRLFKRVVTSSKSGLWDEVAVTQIRSLTSPYLRALWPPSVALLPAIVTPDSAHSHRHRRGYLSARTRACTSPHRTLFRSGSIPRSFTSPWTTTRVSVRSSTK